MDKKNYVFIDGNNFYLGAKSQHINLDYKKFRLYLKTKFNADKVFIFIGYDQNNTALYSYLQKIGYVLVHKPTVIFMKNGKRYMKGNVDAELVLYAAAIEYRNYHQAIIITSDGDFACLMKFLQDKNKLAKVITPTKKYSTLLKPFGDFILPLAVIKDKVKKPAFAFGQDLRLVRLW